MRASKNDRAERLRDRTNERIAEFRTEMQATADPVGLLTLWDRVNDFGQKTTSELISNGLLDLLQSLQKEIVELGEEVSKKIATDPRFSQFQSLDPIIRSTIDYWRRRIRSSGEEIAEIYRQKGAEYHKKKNYKEALDFYDKAIEVNPDRYENWYERGNLLMDMEDFSGAIGSFEIAVDINPAAPNTLCNLGLSFFNLRRYEDSVKYFNRTLEIDPNHVTALIGLGKALLRLRKFAEAEEPLRLAWKLDSESIQVNLAMGALYHDGFNNFKEAQKYAEKVLKIDKDNVVAKADLAETNLAFNEYYEDCLRKANEVLATGNEKYGYPMRLVRVCSLYFRGAIVEAGKAAQDLVEYYAAFSRNDTVSWNFAGLRKIVEEKKMSEKARSVIFSLIDLAESTDEFSQRRIMAELPGKIRSVKVPSIIPPPIKEILSSAHDYIFGSKEKKPEPTIRKEIKVTNTSSPDSRQPGYYRWSVYLTPKDALGQVEKVKYTLHPSFPQRLREEETTDRDNSFRISRRGWGEFQVRVDIFFENGEKLTKYHWLKLRPSTQRKR